jgi:hypothetical protein
VQGRDGHRAADQEGDRNVTVTKLLRGGIKWTAIRDLVRYQRPPDWRATRLALCAKSLDGLARRVHQRCGCEVSFMF